MAEGGLPSVQPQAGEAPAHQADPQGLSQLQRECSGTSGLQGGLGWAACRAEGLMEAGTISARC